jgi:hypothetical protein
MSTKGLKKVIYNDGALGEVIASLDTVVTRNVFKNNITKKAELKAAIQVVGNICAALAEGEAATATAAKADGSTIAKLVAALCAVVARQPNLVSVLTRREYARELLALAAGSMVNLVPAGELYGSEGIIDPEALFSSRKYKLSLYPAEILSLALAIQNRYASSNLSDPIQRLIRACCPGATQEDFLLDGRFSTIHILSEIVAKARVSFNAGDIIRRDMRLIRGDNGQAIDIHQKEYLLTSYKAMQALIESCLYMSIALGEVKREVRPSANNGPGKAIYTIPAGSNMAQLVKIAFETKRLFNLRGESDQKALDGMRDKRAGAQYLWASAFVLDGNIVIESSTIVSEIERRLRFDEKSSDAVAITPEGYVHPKAKDQKMCNLVYFSSRPADLLELEKLLENNNSSDAALLIASIGATAESKRRFEEIVKSTSEWRPAIVALARKVREIVSVPVSAALSATMMRATHTAAPSAAVYRRVPRV